MNYLLNQLIHSAVELADDSAVELADESAVEVADESAVIFAINRMFT